MLVIYIEWYIYNVSKTKYEMNLYNSFVSMRTIKLSIFSVLTFFLIPNLMHSQTNDHTLKPIDTSVVEVLNNHDIPIAKYAKLISSNNMESIYEVDFDFSDKKQDLPQKPNVNVRQQYRNRSVTYILTKDPYLESEKKLSVINFSYLHDAGNHGMAHFRGVIQITNDDEYGIISKTHMESGIPMTKFYLNGEEVIPSSKK